MTTDSDWREYVAQVGPQLDRYADMLADAVEAQQTCADPGLTPG